MVFEKLDAVYCINLERRKDRWDQFQDLWKDIDSSIEQFLAVDANNLEIDETTYRKDPSHNKASIACTLSHIQVLERAIYLGQKEIMILEDDAQPCKNFKELFDLAYKQLPSIYSKYRPDYNFCYVGGTNMEPPEKITENVGKAIHTKSTVGYLIKTEFAKHIVPIIKKHALNLVIDEIYLGLQPHYLLHIFTPRLIHQFESYSDIIDRNIYYSWMRDLE